MNITIINDCKDGNAVGRQLTRTASLIEGNISFVGVNSDLEAAGNLIDVMDAYGEGKGVVLVNVAPRNGKAKKWENGTPFGYFWHKNVLVVSSIDGLTLSLVKKLKLVEYINIMDIPTVMDKFVAENILTHEIGDRVVNTQFRSYEFLPRVAAYLLENKEVVSKKTSIAEFEDAPKGVWWVDNFGNCKTTILKTDIEEGEFVETKIGSLKYFKQLKEVPDKESALIVGSSGINDHRFLEVVVQGENANKILGFNSGDTVL